MTTRRAICAGILLCAGWLLSAAPARAETDCRATATALDFGSVSGNSPVNATATVTLECSTRANSPGARTVVRVRACLHLGTGSSGGGSTDPRRMASPQGDRLAYQLYQDPARTLVWGSRHIPAIPGFVARDIEYQFAGRNGATSRTIVIHGQVPAQDAVAAGSFASQFDAAHTALEFQAREGSGTGTPWPTSCIAGGTDGGGVRRFPFAVSAQVPAHCRIAAATDLAFGSVPGLIANHRDRTSSITLECTGRTPWHLALDDGRHASGNIRRMRRADSGDLVQYELYHDATRLQRWGSRRGIDTREGTGTGTPQSVTVHGRVPAGQSVRPGLYSDTVTVTVTY